ncbi:MAG: phosphate acyltransferase PlsX [Bacteroidales bacterium]|nr:phosphate acyltransferase PlsX [Bacteroidales bacterium]
MRIGLDIMGGDHAPKATVKGAVLAREILPPDCELVLIGEKDNILKECQTLSFDSDRFTIIHAEETISMNDHPVRAFSVKKKSSMYLGFEMLSHNELDGFCSAGNTGAMLAGAMFTIKSIPGVIRPSISVSIPKGENDYTLLLDVGLNPDVRPDVLYQFGFMGALFARYVHGVENPRVGLLNIGSEPEKGNLLTKSTFQVMQDSPDYLFIGNVEGNELFGDRADVVVCDGFSGNVILKQTESFYGLMRKINISHPFFEKFNYENFGGTPILGIGSPVLIGHGMSSSVAIKNMILKNQEIILSGLIKKMIKAFE